MRVSVDQNKIIYVTKLKLNSVTSTMYQTQKGCIRMHNIEKHEIEKVLLTK